MRVVLQTKSASETVRLGRQIGGYLLPGDTVALAGELGAGKTHLIKGLASGAGVRRTRYLTSPSFTLIHEYEGKIPFYHIDLYRLKAEKEAEDLGLAEFLQGKGIAAIEWADRIPSYLPEDVLWIRLSPTGEKTRSVEIEGKGERFEALGRALSGQEASRTAKKEARCKSARS